MMSWLGTTHSTNFRQIDQAFAAQPEYGYFT